MAIQIKPGYNGILITPEMRSAKKKEMIMKEDAIKQAHGHLIRIRYELQKAGTEPSQDVADRSIAIAYELVGTVIELLRSQDAESSK